MTLRSRWCAAPLERRG